jgi:hypothetical protein
MKTLREISVFWALFDDLQVVEFPPLLTAK